MKAIILCANQIGDYRLGSLTPSTTLSDINEGVFWAITKVDGPLNILMNKEDPLPITGGIKGLLETACFLHETYHYAQDLMTGIGNFIHETARIKSHLLTKASSKDELLSEYDPRSLSIENLERLYFFLADTEYTPTLLASMDTASSPNYDWNSIAKIGAMELLETQAAVATYIHLKAHDETHDSLFDEFIDKLRINHMGMRYRWAYDHYLNAIGATDLFEEPSQFPKESLSLFQDNVLYLLSVLIDVALTIPPYQFLSKRYYETKDGDLLAEFQPVLRFIRLCGGFDYLSSKDPQLLLRLLQGPFDATEIVHQIESLYHWIPTEQIVKMWQEIYASHESHAHGPKAIERTRAEALRLKEVFPRVLNTSEINLIFGDSIPIPFRTTEGIKLVRLGIGGIATVDGKPISTDTGNFGAKMSFLGKLWGKKGFDIDEKLLNSEIAMFDLLYLKQGIYEFPNDTDVQRMFFDALLRM